VAEQGKIQNENNMAGSRVCNFQYKLMFYKLVLISLKTGEAIQLGKSFKDAKNLVQSGDAVMLEYEDSVAVKL